MIPKTCQNSPNFLSLFNNIWEIKLDTVVLSSNLSWIRSEGWGFKSCRHQKSFSFQIDKNLFAEVRAEVDQQKSAGWSTLTSRKRQWSTSTRWKTAGRPSCTFLRSTSMVEVDSCLFLGRQQAALFITPHLRDKKNYCCFHWYKRTLKERTWHTFNLS